MSQANKYPLTLTDVKKEGVLEFDFYAKDFNRLEEYEDFVRSIFSVLVKYGVVVDICSPETMPCG